MGEWDAVLDHRIDAKGIGSDRPLALAPGEYWSSMRGL